MKSNSDVNKAFNIFLEIFSNLIQITHLFHIRIIIKNNNNINRIIWINNKIKNAIKKIHRDSITLNNTVSIARYKRYRNNVNNILRKQKNAAHKQFFCIIMFYYISIIVQICGLKLRN